MKVLCIDDDFSQQKSRKDFKHLKQLPLQGQTYTVVMQYISNGVCAFILNELHNPYPNRYGQLSFKAKRFVCVQNEHLLSIQQITQEFN